MEGVVAYTTITEQILGVILMKAIIIRTSKMITMFIFGIKGHLGWVGAGRFSLAMGLGYSPSCPTGYFWKTRKMAHISGYQYEAKILFCAWLDADTRKHARMCVGAY